MADKVVYMRPGETLEIRHLTHEDFDRNSKSWQDQPRPRNDLVRVNGPHSVTPATSMTEFHHWKTWKDAPAVKSDAEGCPACGGTGRMGPFFLGGLSTVCGNCQSPAPQPNVMPDPAIQRIANIAHAILAEAPPEANDLDLFKDCEGKVWPISLYNLRAIAALAPQPNAATPTNQETPK